jgi:ribosome biogenesis protein MAK21
MYKNPKEINRTKDLSRTKVTRRLARRYAPSDDKRILVNSAAYMKKDVEDIPADEMFYYKFFKQKDQLHPELRSEEPKSRGEDDDTDGIGADDEGSVDFSDDFDEAEIEEALIDGLEQQEGSTIKDRKVSAGGDDDEFDYDQMDTSDIDEESDLEAGDNDEAGPLGDDDFTKMLMEDEMEGSDGDDDAGDDAGGFAEGSDAEEDEDKSGSKKPKGKNRFGRSSFASIDEFQHLLETSGVVDDEKQVAWEEGRLKKQKGGFKRKRPDKGKPASNKNSAPSSKKKKR